MHGFHRGPAALYGAGMEFVATAYFWTFYITAFYLLLSVLLAVVLDSYSDMKSQWTASLGVWEEIRSVFMLAR